MALANAYDVLSALRERLNNKPEIKVLLGRGAKYIPINGPMNETATNAPWMGVYLTRNSIRPNAMPKGWLHTFHIAIVIQASDPRDPDACAERLETLVKHSLDVLADDVRIGNTVDAVTEMEISYTNVERGRQDVHFQMAVIDLIAEVRKNARAS